MKVTLIYDYNPDGSKRPVWLLIDLSDEELTEHEKTLYVDVRKPKSEFVGTFDDDFLGCSVCLNELTTGRTNKEFGIDLLTLRQRINNFENVHRFIVLASDVAEVMAISESI